MASVHLASSTALVSFQSTLVCAGWNYNNCAVAAIHFRVSLIYFSLEGGDVCRTTDFWHRQVRPRAKPNSADSTAPDLQTAKGTDDSLLLLLKSAQKIQLIHNSWAQGYIHPNTSPQPLTAATMPQSSNRGDYLLYLARQLWLYSTC